MASSPASDVMELMEPDCTGMPSMTYKGELLALNEPIPRIFNDAEAPGWPDEELNCTPGALPCSISIKDTVGISFILSALTLDAEPA